MITFAFLLTLKHSKLQSSELRRKHDGTHTIIKACVIAMGFYHRKLIIEINQSFPHPFFFKTPLWQAIKVETKNVQLTWKSLRRNSTWAMSILWCRNHTSRGNVISVMNYSQTHDSAELASHRKWTRSPIGKTYSHWPAFIGWGKASQYDLQWLSIIPGSRTDMRCRNMSSFVIKKRNVVILHAYPLNYQLAAEILSDFSMGLMKIFL